MVGLTIIVFIVGVIAMWYTLHSIVYKKKNKPQKFIYFLIGSIVLYLTLSYCFTEILKYRF
ncbi:hypothetical protein [Staphylococcus aureus]|uniref:hypothetical protein n=1 Tax=Staphylococcus aureus TaxID=1280 RepID=UPI00044759FA|nr:hypothetical protein [Staphylococcus aureus]EGQ3127603.1 hypothetical protein [Staphylococcus pseudintermedius]EZZ41285.1 hypothetical protein V111_02632 [Staphylococcus aureus Tur-20]MCE6047468.1 hypothetical protein [Staphylococcus aureus]NHE44204.1 hypothetical protein [Staphylococcus aureus]HDE0571486.1 hypothetical protein [Staphylococcus aureus]